MDYLFRKLTENIKCHDDIIIMTHKHPDLDGMSSAICLYFVIKAMKKNAFVVLDNSDVNDSLKKSFDILKNNNIIIDFLDYSKVVYDCFLLVVLDTQKPELVQDEQLLNIQDIFVIDHHVNSSVHIKNTLFEYIDSNKSSIVEIMVDYLKYLNMKIDSLVATLMLTGLDIDTHSYSLKTTDRTFSAASFLTNCGADNTIKNEILKVSFEDVIKRNSYIKKSYFIKDGFLLCDMGSNIDNVTDLAIMADELLRLDGVQVSFTVGTLKTGVVSVSARSMGKVSVNVIMESIGGGGHVTDAGASFNNKNNKEVILMIEDAIKEE